MISLSLFGCSTQSNANDNFATEQGTETTLENSDSSEVSTKSSESNYDSVVYADADNWAYLESDVQDKEVDVFFLAPTMYDGGENQYNMSLDDTETKNKFLGAINMEKGIYDDNCRFFAPYYRQIGNNVYSMPVKDREPYLQIAFSYVKEAFEYYMTHYNNGRPIIIAGFSQGADMSMRIVKECFTTQERQKKLIACYAIGWNITQQEVDKYPQLKFATGEKDTGVVISFNSEAENVESSLMIPKGVKTLAINPLNWKTDSTYAPASMNMGACFTNFQGEITKEVDNLTGAYIDEKRGALKVDITPETFPEGIKPNPSGVFHGFDFQLFYRNLEQNVKVRIDSFFQNDIAS